LTGPFGIGATTARRKEGLNDYQFTRQALANAVVDPKAGGRGFINFSSVALGNHNP